MAAELPMNRPRQGILDEAHQLYFRRLLVVLTFDLPFPVTSILCYQKHLTFGKPHNYTTGISQVSVFH
jgi:hypothetical protein